ncbi:helix-turn-helix domain-containing protein [Paeniglutamicibacter sp. NPDC091659]|uniref:helix-turn-helix domain-containing protein n=1 Tax=Paeniglutamicibacter sp. NPDC091659 TaxID=3364389 RepID=UPI003827CF46
METRNAGRSAVHWTALVDEHNYRGTERFASGASARDTSGPGSISEPWTIRALSPKADIECVKGWRHGSLSIAHITGDAVSFHRSSAHLGDGYDRYIQICLINSGKIYTRQRGEESAGEADSVLALLLDHEFFSTTSNHTDVLLFDVPRSYFETRGINTEIMAASVLNRVPVAAPIRALVESALRLQEDGDESLRDCHERAILELLTGLGTLSSEGFELMDKHSVALRANVLGVIDAAYVDPQTSVDTLARAVGVSRRQLYRLFEGRNVSVAGMLRERRLDHAEMLLRHPGNSPISFIAESSGFNGPDQLSRAMRDRHGRSPREYRAEIRSQS